MIILSIIFIFIIFIGNYFYNIYNQFYYNNNNQLLGIDKQMGNSWDYNFVYLNLEFEDDIPNLEEKIIKFLLKYLDDDKSKLRLQLSNNKSTNNYSYTMKIKMF